LHNFRRALTDPVFQIAIKNTLIYTFFTIAFEFALGLTLAMFLYKKKKGIGLIRSILLIPMMVAYIVTGLMWKFMYLPEGGFINSALNLVGIRGPAWLSQARWAMPALIIMSLWKNTPFVFLILLAALQSLSPEYFEAAVIDGASGWQVLRHITLPLLQPIIFVIMVLRLTDAIRIFDEVFVMTRGGPGYATETMSLYIYNMAFESFNMGYSAATSYIMIGITVLFSYACYRLLYSKETI